MSDDSRLIVDVGVNLSPAEEQVLRFANATTAQLKKAAQAGFSDVKIIKNADKLALDDLVTALGIASKAYQKMGDQGGKSAEYAALRFKEMAKQISSELKNLGFKDLAKQINTELKSIQGQLDSKALTVQLKVDSDKRALDAAIKDNKKALDEQAAYFEKKNKDVAAANTKATKDKAQELTKAVEDSKKALDAQHAYFQQKNKEKKEVEAKNSAELGKAVKDSKKALDETFSYYSQKNKDINKLIRENIQGEAREKKAASAAELRAVEGSQKEKDKIIKESIGNSLKDQRQAEAERKKELTKSYKAQTAEIEGARKEYEAKQNAIHEEQLGRVRAQKKARDKAESDAQSKQDAERTAKLQAAQNAKSPSTQTEIKEQKGPTADEKLARLRDVQNARMAREQKEAESLRAAQIAQDPANIRLAQFQADLAAAEKKDLAAKVQRERAATTEKTQREKASQEGIAKNQKALDLSSLAEKTKIAEVTGREVQQFQKDLAVAKKADSLSPKALASVRNNEFLNKMSQLRNETASSTDPQKSLNEARKYLDANKDSLTDAQKRSLTGFIAGSEGRVSRSRDATTNFTRRETRADYKDQIGAELQRIDSRRQTDPTYSLAAQHKDLEALRDGITLSPKDGRSSMDDLISKKDKARLNAREAKARLAAQRYQEEKDANDPDLNPFYRDPRHEEQLARLRNRKTAQSIRELRAKDLQGNTPKAIYDGIGKSFDQRLAELPKSSSDLNPTLVAKTNANLLQANRVSDQAAKQQAEVAAVQLKRVEAQKAADTKLANAEAKSTFYGIRNNLSSGAITKGQAAYQLQNLLDKGGLSDNNKTNVESKISSLVGQIRKNQESKSSGSQDSQSALIGQLQNSLLSIGFSTLAIATTNLARKMVDAAATVELAQRRIGIVVKNPEQATNYFKFLKRYEKDTAFELPEVLNAGAAFASQQKQLARAGLSKESGIRLAGELGSLNPDAGLIEGQRAISRIIAGDPNGLEILRSKFAITNDVLKEGGARVTDSGVSLQSTKNRTAVIAAIQKYVQDTTGGRGAEDQATTLSGRISTLNSQTFTSLAAVMEPLIPKLKEIVTSFTQFLTIIEKAPPILKELTGEGILLAAGFFSLTATLGGLAIIVNAVRSAVAGLTASYGLNRAAAVASLASRALSGPGLSPGTNVVLPAGLGSQAATAKAVAPPGFLKGGTSFGFIGGALGFGALALAIGSLIIALEQNTQAKMSKNVDIETASNFLGRTSKQKLEYDLSESAFEADYDAAYASDNKPEQLKQSANAAERKKFYENQLRNEQIRLQDDLELDVTDPRKKAAEVLLDGLSIKINKLGAMALGATVDLQGLGERISAFSSINKLGNNDAATFKNVILNDDDYKKLDEKARSGKLTDAKEKQDYYNYRNQIKEADDRSDAERVGLSQAQSNYDYAGKGGASAQERIGLLREKAAGLKSNTTAEVIAKIQAETAVREEEYKTTMAYKQRRIDAIRLLKGEEKAKILEINKAEVDSLREIGRVASVKEQQKSQDRLASLKNASVDTFKDGKFVKGRFESEETKAAAVKIAQIELDSIKETANQAAIIRQKANADRITTHIEMLEKIANAERENVEASLEVEKTLRDTNIASLSSGKNIAGIGEQFMTAQEKLANLKNIQDVENNILKIKREQTVESIKDIDARTDRTVTALQRELRKAEDGGEATPELRKAKQEAIRVARRKGEADKKALAGGFNNEKNEQGANQTAEDYNRTKAANLQTYDQKIAEFEQGKAEIEAAQAANKALGYGESEFTRIDNLKKAFDFEKKIIELKRDRAQAELPEKANAEKDQIRRKAATDILKLQSDYLQKSKETGNELERQNRILELQKKLKDENDKSPIYGIDALNQRMKDESELFRLQAGFGGKKGGAGKFGQDHGNSFGRKGQDHGNNPSTDFTFGDPSLPNELRNKTANDVFSKAGEGINRDANGKVIKPNVSPSSFVSKLPNIIMTVPVMLNGKEVGSKTKEIDLNSKEFSNMNHDVKQGGRTNR